MYKTLINEKNAIQHQTTTTKLHDFGVAFTECGGVKLICRNKNLPIYLDNVVTEKHKDLIYSRLTPIRTLTGRGK